MPPSGHASCACFLPLGRAPDEIERLARATRRIGDCNMKRIAGSAIRVEFGIFSCHARVFSTDARPLSSVVMTSVGHLMRARSSETSQPGIVWTKPSWVDTGVRPINFAHHSWPSRGKLDPRRLPIVERAHASTPSVSISFTQVSSTPGLCSRRAGGTPTRVRVCTRSGKRAAKRRPIVPAILAPTRWKRSIFN